MALVSHGSFRRKLKLIIFIFLAFCMLKVFLMTQHLPSDVTDKRSHLTQNKQKPHKTCKEKKNFVFIKILKCAGTTMTGIFRRFAYRRNLTLVLPVRRNLYLNFPRARLTNNDFRPSKRQHNILIDHSVFPEYDLNQLMPADTAYISSIRHPFSQLKSSINYFSLFGLDNFYGIPEPEGRVYKYLSDIDTYENVYQENKARINHCHPDGFSLHKNIMSHFLGMPLGFPAGSKDISSDDAAVKSHIRHIDDKFGLIMITEYFIESLILLKRLMCWEFSDLVSIGQNVMQYKQKNQPDPQEYLDLHRKFSHADYLLYDYFNASLWRRIEREGPEFHQEVRAFRRVQTQVENYCAALRELRDPNLIPSYLVQTRVAESQWSPEFNVTSKDCWYLVNPYPLLFVMQEESDVRDRELVERQEAELREVDRLRAGRLLDCSKAVP